MTNGASASLKIRETARGADLTRICILRISGAAFLAKVGIFKVGENAFSVEAIRHIAEGDSLSTVKSLERSSVYAAAL